MATTNLTPEETARAAAFREMVKAKNEAKKAGTPDAQYVTNEKGQTTSQYNQGNSTYNVLPGSVFDPLSPNYNQIVANSGGKISLSDLDSNGKITMSGYESRLNGGSTNGGSLAGSSGIYTPATYSGVGSSYVGGIQSEIEKLRQAQTNAAVASLGKARDSALSNLSAEKAQIAPTYYAKKNAASTGSQLAAKNFAEYMASRGGTSSGVSAQAELNRQGQLSGETGSINRAEANAFIENDRRVTDVGNAYASDVASAEAGAQATYLQNMINEMNTARQLAIQQNQFNQNLALQIAGLTGNYNGSPTMAAQQMAISKAMQEAGLTGYYNGTPTLANQQYQTGVSQYNQNYQTDLERYNREYQDRQTQQEFENWLAQQQLALSQQRATSGSGYNGSNNTLQNVEDANAATRKYVTQIIGALQSGASMADIVSDIDELERTGRASSEKVNTQLLRNLANSIPVDNWQYLPGY